mgnify:CR=1 FL=1
MALTKRQEIVNLISHELKTPTVPILGYCEMLLNPKFGSLNSDQIDAVNEIMNNIKHMEDFLDEIIFQEKEQSQNDSLQILPKGLKTPLVPILGYCEMLVNSKLGSLSTDQNEAVKEIQQNAIQLNHLIFDFWNAQQLDLGKMKYFYEDVNVNELIKHLERDLSNLIIGKNIEFSKLIESEIHITTDESKLFEIFKNLIENSSNFVPEIGGKIQISVKPDDSFVQFSVEDNGSGIAKEKMNLLFKKFHQIDTSHRRVHSGGGLGLTICKGYIEDMGGKIWAKSEIDIGTTFFFTLPKNQGEKL